MLYLTNDSLFSDSLDLCKRCKFYKPSTLLGVSFCYHSSRTNAKYYRLRPNVRSLEKCDDYAYNAPVELSLF